MYFVVDLEATCWEKKNVRDRNEIIEIGLVICGNDGKILKTYNSFVKPIYNNKLSIFCKKLTCIHQEWIDNAFSLRETLSFMLGEFDHDFNLDSQKIPWCAVGRWDKACLQRDCERHGIMFPFGCFIDLKALYVDYSGCQNCGLKESLKNERMVFDGNPHRALDDALNAAKLSRFLITHEIIKQAEQTGIAEEENASD